MLKMKLQITDSKLGTVTCSILQHPPTLQPTLSEFLAQGDLITKTNTNIFVFLFFIFDPPPLVPIFFFALISFNKNSR